VNNIPLEFSVVIPTYKNEKDIFELYSRLAFTLESIVNSFEIIFVNDGSPDSSWKNIKEISKKDPRVKGISFSKNYGQHQAIKAGVNCSKGRWITVMDCDLQDCPEDIPLMYQYALDNQFDMVIGQRSLRKDHFLTRFWASFFYKIYNQLIDFKYDKKTANFGVYSRKVIDAVKLFQEDSQSFGYLVNIVGFKKGFLPVNHGERKNGKSSYSFWNKLSLSLDLIISNSNKPMKVIIFVGFIISLLSFLLALYLVAKYFWNGSSVPGWFSLATILFMQTGIVTFFFGITGLYINKVYMASKNRPSFIINELTFEQISEK
jgi:glycosyltransferase involved in cell wall biosynthesis